MSVVPISAHLAYKWKTRPIALPQSWLNVQKDFGFGPTGLPRAFLFRRRKMPDGWRAEVWLQFTGGLRLNLSVDLDVWPKSRDEARGFAVQFARDHGFTAREVRKRVAAVDPHVGG